MNHEGQDAERIPLNLEQKETVDQFGARGRGGRQRWMRSKRGDRGGLTSQVVNCETSVSGSQWQFAVMLSSVGAKPAMDVSLAALPLSSVGIKPGMDISLAAIPLSSVGTKVGDAVREVVGALVGSLVGVEVGHGRVLQFTA